MNASEGFNVVEMVDSSPVPKRAEIQEYSSDPVKFFHLHGQPFADSVNPDLFYRTEAHEAAYIAMKRCVDEDISLALTTAVAGTGKTLLTQVLLQELDPTEYRPALVLIYPKMSRTALLQEIANELEVEMPDRRAITHELVAAIQQRIMDLYLRNIKPVLIIDEVHFLTADNLQVLRTLSNIEVPQRKLLTILLFGESSFLQKIRKPNFKSILSRMYTRVELRPLTESEIEQYVKFRLLLSHGDPALFSPECYGWLQKASSGIPREINRLCHNALQLAAEQSRGRVTYDILRAANPGEGA